MHAAEGQMVKAGLLWHNGTPLPEVLAEIEPAITTCVRSSNFIGTRQLLGFRRAIRQLQGVAPEAIVAEERAGGVPEVMPSPPAEDISYELVPLEVALLMRDLPAVERFLAAAARASHLRLPTLQEVELTYYSGLAHAAPANGENRAAIASIAPHLAKLQRWADLDPENFAHKHLLVAAELARLEGRGFEAMALYDQAVGKARKSGFVQDEALANELCGRFFVRLGRQRIAALYLTAASAAYARWGATAKVQALDEEFPAMAEASTSSSPSTTALDVRALLHAAETISSEVVLSRLMKRLMEVCLAAAGAERGALMLQEGGDDGGELAVRALGSVGQPVQLRRELLRGSAEVPVGLIEEVRRTGQPLALADASRVTRSPDEPYLVQRAPRSVLVVPIRREDRLVGVLYLENNLAPHVFSPDRVQILHLLGAQMAVSLENSLLFERAERAIKLRDDFLTIASHELNTPLASLQLMAEGLEDGTLGPVPPALTRPLRLIVRQGRKLKILVEDMLQVAMIDRGPLPLRLQGVELSAILTEVAEKLREDLVRADCTLSLAVPSSIVGNWDRRYLEHALFHLLSNALKFGSGKPIVVKAEVVGARALISVRDHGIGILPERLPHIFDFDRFERAVSVAHYGGLGLGLYITKQLIDSMNGKITVESNVDASAENAGTTFRIELPYAPGA